MIELWKVRVKRAMRALGWPGELMAQELGIGRAALLRVLKGGRPSVDALKRLQVIERKYERQIEKLRADTKHAPRKAYAWPPRWVECGKRRWIGGPEVQPPSRPADLQALGGDRTDGSTVLTGWLDPRNFPGRTLRVVDFTAEGRRRYAEDRENEARRRDSLKSRSGAVVDGCDERKT